MVGWVKCRLDWRMVWSQWKDGCRVVVQRAVGSRYQGSTKAELSPRGIIDSISAFKIFIA